MMREFVKGVLLSLVINAVTVAGWYFLSSMWAPSIFNVLIAFIILGIYGLEDKWAFPSGYWTIQLLAFVMWLMGVGGLLNMTNVSLPG